MHRSAAKILVDQRLSLSPIDLAIEQRPAGENAAYDLQSDVNALLADRLGNVAGHKIGCTTPVMQKFLSIESPCAGRVFAKTVLEGHGQVARSHYRKLGVECEIAVEIGLDIEPSKSERTPKDLLPHIKAVMAGIEIVDDRYADYRSLGVHTLIADNFFNAGCVLGEPVSNWRGLDLATLTGRMRINDAEVGHGTGAMVMGDPFNALTWLANKRSARGEGLRRGEFVFLGSLVETKWVNEGDTVRIEVAGLGEASLAVTG
jgi:2-keto-4-pentenoate hydratase